MTFISIDKILMQDFIDKFEKYASIHDFEVGEVKLVNWQEDDPADVGHRVSIGSTLSNKGTEWKELATQLQDRLDEAVSINSSGVTVDDDNDPNTVNYYLPDGVDDTVDNVKAYNSQSIENAKSESAALWQAYNSMNGRSDDGRTAEEILREINKHRDIPIYAAAFVKGLEDGEPYSEQDIDETGGERLLDMMTERRQFHSDEEMPPGLETLGHVMAAASQDEVGGAELAKDVYEGDGSDMSWDDKVTLNAVLSNIPTPFGTDFLVDIAERSESQKPDAYKGDDEVGINAAYYNDDVLGGALTAMGNNNEAALAYLMPEDDGKVGNDGYWHPGDTTHKRWELLESRKWNESGLEGFTAALGSASVYRNSSDSGLDARATWAAGHGIDHFAGGKYSKGDFTEKMKENLSLLIANSPEETTAAANGRIISKEGEGPNVGAYNVDSEDISALAYRIIDDEDAAATMASGLGNYHHNAIDASLSNSDRAALTASYGDAAASQGFLEEIAEQRMADNKLMNDKAKARVETALGVLSTVAVTGATVASASLPGAAPVLIPLGVDVASSLSRPVALDYITEQWDTSQQKMAEVPSRSSLQAQAYADAIHAGLLADDIKESAKKSDLFVGPDGTEIDRGPSEIDKEYSQRAETWADGVTADSSLDEESRDWITGLKNSVGNGLEEGRDYAKASLPAERRK